jgi:hypothetical protein
LNNDFQYFLNAFHEVFQSVAVVGFPGSPFERLLQESMAFQEQYQSVWRNWQMLGK